MREEQRTRWGGPGRVSGLVPPRPRVGAVVALLAGLVVLGSAGGLTRPALVAAQQPQPSGSEVAPSEPGSPSAGPEATATPERTAPPESTVPPAAEAPSSETGTSSSPSASTETGAATSASENGDTRLPLASERSPDVRPGPGRSWTLTASSLTLRGVHYHGFAMREVAGEKVRTMHFTVDELLIRDLVQRGDLGNGKVARVAADPGSVSTITEGPIELYTQKLTGTLNVVGYPLVPVEMSPEAFLLPDVDLGFLELPELTFSDAVVRNAELSGGKLFIPGAGITLE
ncbi:hypothetical protein SAMN04487819_10291 [Actinopolyspora alba]|uniref:Uncharacterized protein n=1 Tax=Actinopolyspora alba TaxID=673379 RepID=A0A1I1UCN9_9ACTN|nr:hypothetical protein [Actinopolyspora alba]SFD68606.1 hypothetical protein SAMN04487819_10291 [Actinopolyspora alba]